MHKLRSFRVFLFGLFLLALLIPSCHKDPVFWNPEVMLTLKPDSGLTTQTFDFKVDIPNLPSSQQEFYVRWDMNGDSVWDDSFTSLSTATHRFYQKGTHQIRAEILTKDGQRLVLNKAIRVEQGYSAPHAAFTVDPPESHYLTEFTFDAGTTFDDEDPFSMLQFRWDFENDGVWDTNPSSDPVTRHTYKRSGNYSVKLMVTDPTRRVETESKILVVNMHDELIKPGFNWSPSEATVKDTFLLNASETHHETDSTRIFTYTWDIRNEVTYGPFTDPVFPHQFMIAGMQTVTLTTTDQFGLSNQITKEFFVIKENKPPTPKILVPTPIGNIATNFWLSSWPSTDDVTPPSGMLFRWDFEGDGIWDTGWTREMTLYHQFSEPGNYWVTLQAEDEGGERGITKTRFLVTKSTNPTGFIQDRRDGKYYGTVKIDDQWWMSDNLDYRIGWKRDIGLLQICYNEQQDMCDQYGGLYQGERTVSYSETGQNICPEGWRVPIRQDWQKLGEHIDLNSGRNSLMVGGSMGFNAHFAGTASFVIINNDTIYYFRNLNDEARFLSLTIRPFLDDMRSQFFLGLLRESPGVYVDWSDRRSYFSVRCIKND